MEEGPNQLYGIEKRTWPELEQHVQRWTDAGGADAGSSAHSFNFKRMQNGVLRLYCLGIPEVGYKEHSLVYVDISEDNSDLVWRRLLTSMEISSTFHAFSKEEILLRERQRCMFHGITSYQFHHDSGTFAFSSGGTLHRATENVSTSHHDKDATATSSFSAESFDLPNYCSVPLDTQICPVNPQLLSFVAGCDMYLQIGTTTKRLTHKEEDTKRDISAGMSSYIIQEEFDRCQGMWWQPKRSQGQDEHRYFLLYEETDNSMVGQITICIPATKSKYVEEMKYPRAGERNSCSTLKMLEITLGYDEATTKLDGTVFVSELCMQESFKNLFPWTEYIVRAGWMPCGSAVWVQLLSRKQDRLVLAHIPLAYFVSLESSMEDLTQVPPPVSVLCEEVVDRAWVAVHDLFYVFHEQPVDNAVTFIWCSEKTEFAHLYLITSVLGVGLAGPQMLSQIAITYGDWNVMKRAEIYVDESRGHVFFVGLKDSPIEPHIYVASYLHPGKIDRLSQSGFSHHTSRGADTVCFDKDYRYFVTTCSNVTLPLTCVLYRLDYKVAGALPSATIVALIRSQSSDIFERPLLTVDLLLRRGCMSDLVQDAAGDYYPQILSFPSQHTGLLHYAMVMRPTNYVPGVKYPCVQMVYGGPEIQLVRNVFQNRMGYQKFTKLGYVVVMIDGRGSANRGLRFEASVYEKFGTVEITDQVDGLLFVTQATGMIDMERVAMKGWSYGGYMALMCLCQRPDVYKVAIAGAPVTAWELYDTAYTERYMGLPSDNPEGYKRGAVLEYVDKFPNEAGRLLIFHGLIDENVHFAHTAALIGALCRAGKPYQLQIFPGERHAVRSPSVNLHADTTILNFLQENL